MTDVKKEEFTPKTEEEIKSEVMKDFEFDETDDASRITTLTKERLDNQTKMSTAINQKKTWREKAEAASEALKDKPEGKPKEPNENDDKLPTREELVLIAQGMTEEELVQAETISKGKGITLAEAIKDPLYESWKTSNDAKIKSEQAALKPSAGSGTATKEGWSGLTDEEHKKKFQQDVAKKG